MFWRVLFCLVCVLAVINGIPQYLSKDLKLLDRFQKVLSTSWSYTIPDEHRLYLILGDSRDPDIISVDPWLISNNDELIVSKDSFLPRAQRVKKALPACQDCACGERNEAGRVVGGNNSSVNAFPWLGRVIYRKSFGCAASLINNKFVATAAHCVKGFMWFMFRVTFGEHDRCDHTQIAESRVVLKMIAHDFSLSELSNDIALLMLSSPIEYSHAVRPVCLPTKTEKVYTGTIATVAGWGAINETGKWSCTLMEAELPILSNEVCRNTKYNSSKIKEVMMCAGYPETAHKDACTGDSGGPLVAENEEHMYELIGIVSWGYGCARIGYPGVFTRITKYLDWIKDNTEEGCYCAY